MYLLLGAFTVVIFSIGPEGRAVLLAPKPNDCNWFARPLGDKHCHYDSNVFHRSDQDGDQIIVQWERVNDY
jgi:hypothetical protein